MRPTRRDLLLAVLVAVCVALWVRGAWRVPLRNYAFDFSINYTGGRLLSVRGADRPLYDRLTLAIEAQPYTAYTALYTKLFLTYIQTPITAVLTLPYSRLSFHDARVAFLITSNALLVLSTAAMVWVLRPSRLLIVSACVIFATYEAMFDSLRLGQVDGVIVASLVLSFVLLRRRYTVAGGVPLALAAILKLSPGVVIGYFVVTRRWPVVVGAAAGLGVLLLVSVVVAGWHNNVVFVRDITPRLLKGSTQYDNVAIGGAVSRAHFGRPSWYYEDEVAAWPTWLRAASLLLNGVLVVGAWAIARRDWETGFMLSIAVAILVSPVAWSFYPTWLIPSMLWLLRRWEDRRDRVRMVLFALLYPFLAIVPAHYTGGVAFDWLHPVSVIPGAEQLGQALVSVAGRIMTPEVRADAYVIPIKTITLAAYAALIAAEAWTPVKATGRSRGARVAAAGMH